MPYTDPAKRALCKATWAKNNPQKVKLATDSWYARNKFDHQLEFIAHRRVRDALRKGLIHKMPCAKCGKVKVESHHTDYTKPLEVIWLCKLHHEEEHHGIS